MGFKVMIYTWGTKYVLTLQNPATLHSKEPGVGLYF